MIDKGGGPVTGRRPSCLIEGLAIVSADGMIANAAGEQPDSIMLEADQRFFHERLDDADILVHGRHSGEGGPGMARRKRVVLTRRLSGAIRDPDNANAVLWNPSSAELSDALALLGGANRIAVIGGTDVFGLFLELGYDTFHLSVAANARLPGGRPVFPGVPATSPDILLSRHALKPDATRVLDASQSLTLTTWRR